MFEWVSSVLGTKCEAHGNNVTGYLYPLYGDKTLVCLTCGTKQEVHLDDMARFRWIGHGMQEGEQVGVYQCTGFHFCPGCNSYLDRIYINCSDFASADELEHIRGAE